MQKLLKYLKKRARLIDRALKRFLPKIHEFPAGIHQAIHYSVFPGGKRLRPILVLSICEAFGARLKDALPAACAIELIHNYSLTHDDLPCMDDADYRRGKPSCHKKFGYDQAVLVGDALQSAAFEIIARHISDSALARDITLELATAIGSRGLVGGQHLDLKKVRPSEKIVREIYFRKTAALFQACARIGTLVAGVHNKQILRKMTAFGRNLGILFQTIDDYIDRKQKETKFSLAKIYGPDRTLAIARRLATRAKSAIKFLGDRGEVLPQIVDFIYDQSSAQ